MYVYTYTHIHSIPIYPQDERCRPDETMYKCFRRLMNPLWIHYKYESNMRTRYESMMNPVRVCFESIMNPVAILFGSQDELVVWEIRFQRDTSQDESVTWDLARRIGNVKSCREVGSGRSPRTNRWLSSTPPPQWNCFEHVLDQSSGRGEKMQVVKLTTFDNLVEFILKPGTPQFSVPVHFWTGARRTKFQNSCCVATRVLLRGAGVSFVSTCAAPACHYPHRRQGE
jgi:hypothetical protein